MSVPDPATEKEVFLAKAAGASETLPLTNSTREEIYLRAIAEGGGGGGTSDYTDLTNKPQINGVTLSGDKSLEALGAILHVSVTQDGDAWVLDKTAAELYNAHIAGKRIAFSFTYEGFPAIVYDVSWSIFSSSLFGVVASAVSESTGGAIILEYSSSRNAASLFVYPIKYAVLANTGVLAEASFPVVKDASTGIGYVLAYDTTGNNTNATMTQAAITTAISEANPYYNIDTTASLHSTFRTGFTTLFDSVLASALAAVGTRVSDASSFTCTSVTNLLALCLGLSPKVPQLIVTAASQTMILFLSSQYYNHYFFRAFIPYNDGTDDYNVDCMFMIDPAGMTIAMTAYAA